jgi:hypothetical protein
MAFLKSHQGIVTARVIEAITKIIRGGVNARCDDAELKRLHS